MPKRTTTKCDINKACTSLLYAEKHVLILNHLRGFNEGSQ